MISLLDIIGGRAAFRYDDEGEPKYTLRERILIAIRWHDWIRPGDLYDLIGAEPGSGDRHNATMALAGLVRVGIVERRSFRHWSAALATGETVTTSYVRLAPNAAELVRLARA